MNKVLVEKQWGRFAFHRLLVGGARVYRLYFSERKGEIIWTFTAQRDRTGWRLIYVRKKR